MGPEMFRGDLVLVFQGKKRRGNIVHVILLRGSFLKTDRSFIWAKAELLKLISG